MSDDRFDAIQFGRLIESVERLTISVKILSDDIDSLKETRSRGWGILTGITLAAGSVGAVAHSVVDKILK